MSRAGLPPRKIIEHLAEHLAIIFVLKPREMLRLLDLTARPEGSGECLLPIKAPLPTSRGAYEVVWVLPAFHAVCDAMDKSAAIRVITEKNVDRICQDFLVASYLTDSLTPLASHYELAGHLDRFARHLAAQGELPVRTGFPRAGFSKCNWLDMLLGKLYFVKLPVLTAELHIDFMPTDTDCAVPRFERKAKIADHLPYKLVRAYTHEMIKDPVGARIEELARNCQQVMPAKQLRDAVKHISKDVATNRKLAREWGIYLRTDDDGNRLHHYAWNAPGPRLGLSAYDAAAFLPLAESDRERLLALREPFLRLKSSVLADLAESVRLANPAGIWEGCWPRIAETLGQDDLRFLWGIDHSFYCQAGGWAHSYSPEWALFGGFLPGGLTNLLEVVGHCEKELTIGTLSKARQALGELVGLDDEGQLRFVDGKGCPSSYLDHIRTRKEEALAPIFDRFRALWTEEESFWKGYGRRVRDAVAHCRAFKKAFAPAAEPHSARNAVQPRVAPVEPPKAIERPPEEALAAWRLRDLQGMGQKEVAAALSRQFGRKYEQFQVSRLLKKVRQYLQDGNVLPELPGLAKPVPMAPEKLELGARQDGLSPRQRGVAKPR